jgi:hypothetical protein
MTLDEYNTSVKQILEEQQKIAQSTAQLANVGSGQPHQPAVRTAHVEPVGLMQQIAKLNTELMMGIMAPKK